MKKIKIIYLISLLLLAFEATAQTQLIDSLWRSGNDNYAMGNFNIAIDSYSAIEESGYESPALYYNLANNYYRERNIGKAVLFYEKTLKIDPSNKDAKSNLAMARARCVDKIESLPEFVVVTWVKNIRNSLSSNGWALFAIISFILFLFGIVFFLFSRSKRSKRLYIILSDIFFILLIISFSFAYSLYRNAKRSDSAIITSSVANVKSAPSNSGNSLFVLHEGTKVRLIESVEGWSKIEIADGREGWMLSEEFEVI